MKKDKVLKWIIFSVALATNLFILINSFIFGDASTAESNVITNSAASAINSIAPGTITRNNYENLVVFIRKVFGHFGLFGFSGLISTWAIYLFTRDTKFDLFYGFGGISLLFGFALSWLSEFVQLFIPGRSGAVADVLIDLGGYFIGVLLVIFILFLAKKPIFPKRLQQEKSAV